MGRKAARFGLRERVKLKWACGYYPPNSRMEAGFAVEELERAVNAHPDEWVYWYALGDTYPYVAKIAEGVRACQKCYELRPKDPRSTYALATALRVMGQGSRMGDQIIESFWDWESGYFPGLLMLYSQWLPSNNQNALEELGLTDKEAAQAAIELFRLTIQLGVTRQEEEEIQQSIVALYAAFSELD